MRYVCVNSDTIEFADGCRKNMMRSALDRCAGRITDSEFQQVHFDFVWAAQLCSTQPTAGLTPWLIEQLTDFYPVDVEKTDEGYRVTYCHSSLPKIPTARLPRNVFKNRQPVCVDVEPTGTDAERHFGVTFQQKWVGQPQTQ
jgi:hypothetical protein